MEAITNAAKSPPADYVNKMGWVLIAFQRLVFNRQREPFDALSVFLTFKGDTVVRKTLKQFEDSFLAPASTFR
jgi:hypothetical protein